MTEEEARSQVSSIAGSSMAAIARYADLLLAENAKQNLIARSSETTLWSRHLLDSLQLARFARLGDRTWVDVGSGAGLPGLVLATLDRWTITLVEPRRRRADFLSEVARHLGLANVTVRAMDVRHLDEHHDVVSARAVGSIDRIFDLTRKCADQRTRFVLPKGRSASADVDFARCRWQGEFHVEHSITDREGGIVIADRVCLR